MTGFVAGGACHYRFLDRVMASPRIARMEQVAEVSAPLLG
jgi:hypothetical protein